MRSTGEKESSFGLNFSLTFSTKSSINSQSSSETLVGLDDSSVLNKTHNFWAILAKNNKINKKV